LVTVNVDHGARRMQDAADATAAAPADGTDAARFVLPTLRPTGPARPARRAIPSQPRRRDAADRLVRDRRGARQGAYAAIHDSQPDGSLRTDEMVARWSGRSLAAPRPRFTAPARRPSRSSMLYRLVWTHTKAPDGRLRRLPFAHVYHMLARGRPRGRPA
jgi:hypothetical protein